MADEAYDAALAQHVCQLGMVTAAQVEEARRTQAEAARRGAALSLADALVQLDYLTKVQRENIEPEVRARREGARMLGQYKLLRPLGEGGMGAVFLAEDTIGQRTVAVKVLARKRAGDSQFVSRFRREAKAAGRLNHPNIVGAYTTGVEQGQHYLVMEYCEGESLNKTIRRDGFLPWDRAVEIIIQVAHGLQHAHAHAIIHRDIKPPNIIVANDGTAKILDMGLSKDIGAGEQSFSTQTGMALGTPHYISPEQARGERNIDGRADIYSLGATLYHMVTGRTPFEGLTGAMIMLKHIHEQIPNPQDIREDIPDSVAQVIQKMTAKEPADRYRDCTELLGDLELVLMGKMPTTQVLAVNRSAAAMGVGPARQAAGETPAVGAAQDETAVQAGEQPGQGGQFAQPAEQPGEAVMLAPQQGRRHQPPFLGGGTRKDEPVEEEIELTPVPQEPGARASMWKIICASVGVGLLLVLVTALLSGGPKKKMADGNQPPGPLPPTAAPNTPPGTTGGDNRKPAAPATGTTRAAFGPDDPRERYARNQLDALKAKEKAGSVSAGELRRSLEVFVERYGSTRAGDDAAAWLKTLPAATVYTPAAGGVDDPARWQNAVALLPLVDPGRDAVVGKWELRNGALLSDKTADARIEVPYRPPEEYDVRVVFTPTEGDCDVALHLVKAGRPFLWVMGGNKNTYFGFGPIGGKWCHENGTSAKSSRCLERGLRYTLVVQVRNDGFCAWLDGQRISQWKTDYRDMPTSVGWNLRDPNLLCLRSNNTPVVFHRADVLDVTGKGIVARSKETAAAGRWRAVFDGRTPNCLRGQGYGHWRVDDGALAKVAGTNDAAQTVEEFSDGQVRVCFEPSGGGSMFFTVRQGGGGYSAYFDGGLMAGKVQELAFTCRGDDVTATLNGQRIKLSSGGQSRKGCLQFNAQGGVRVLSIEHRDLPPEGAAATPATPAGAEVVWLDDALPAGAKATGSPEGYAWAWASTPEPVFSGTHSHTQAGKGGNAGGEQHYFVDANPPLGVGRRDVIFAYVYLDPKNPPKEIMMQWSSRKSWEHRAYWGDDKLPWGTNLSPSRVPMGPLPKAGEWVRLEVGASEAGFESDNEEIEGWAFAQYGGSVYWDKAGVVRNAKSAAPVAGVGPAAPTGDAPGPASAETKVAYEKLLTEVYTLLSKSDVKAARARLEQAKATPTLAAVRAALDKDLECASYVEEANKAALTGVALLADKRKFTFRTDDDKEIPTGQGTGSTVTGAKDDVVSIDQDIGGAKAILKRKLADFSPQTRYELACLGMPPGPDGELKLAFAELLALLDGAEGITAKDILNRIDAAEKGQLPREKIEGLRSRVEGRERELDARGAVKKGDALLKAGRRAEAKAYVQELKKRFTGTATLVQWLDARREELAKVLPQPGLIAEYYELKTRIYAEALSDATANAIGKRVVANIDLPAKENLGELFGRQEDVGVRFAGYIAVTEEGTYTFYSKSDDGSMLYIRDTLLVSNDGYRSMTEKSGTITLPPGSHPFRLQFCQGGSGGGVIVSWSGPGFEKQVIPPERFSYDPLETEAAAKPATPRTPPRRSP